MITEIEKEVGKRNKNVQLISKEEKNQKLKSILDKAQDIFMEDGIENFSMRKLADSLDISPGNLYNYIESKRELWYAFITQTIQEYSDKFDEMRMNHLGSASELIDKIIAAFFTREKIQFYRIRLFSRPPPSTKEPGSYERNFKALIMHKILKIINQAIERKELEENKAIFYTYFIASIITGSTLLTYHSEFDSAITLRNPEEYFVFVREQISKLFKR